MQEHPVPQNVTTFEFKLIGDMTLRQFGYVGSGLGIALLFFFLPFDKVGQTPILRYLIQFPVIFIAPICGFALAFIPIEGRPLDRWFVAFIRAVFGNTLYVWQKEGKEVSILHDLPMHQVPDPSQGTVNGAITTATTVMHNNTSGSLPRQPLSPLDMAEQESLARLQLDRLKPIRQVIRPTGPQQSLTPAQPHVAPRMTTFAGPAQPLNRIAARTHMVQGQPYAPMMREPYQRPLVPRKIPLPSYQQATLQSQPVQRAIHFDHPAGQMPFSGLNRPLQPLAMNEQSEINVIRHNMQVLHLQLETVQRALRDYQKKLVTLAGDEVKYQTILTDITQNFSKETKEKVDDEEALAKLKQENASQTTALHDSKVEKAALQNKLEDLQKQLASTKDLLAELQRQKDQLAHLQTPPSISESIHEQATSPGPIVETLHAPKPVVIEPKAADTIGLPLVNEKPVEPEVIPIPAVTQKSMPALTTIANAISGYVFDNNTKPIMDVIVVVKKAKGQTMRALKTNRVGQFSMVSPLPDGDYELSFEKDEYTFPTLAISAKGEVIPAIRVEGETTS